MSYYPPTEEQQAAIDEFTAGNNLVLQAGAGAGKTSTLRFLAQAKPHKRGLYIAFNRSIKEDAARSFPSSVKCATSHSLAFATVGRRYKHRLNGTRQPAWKVAQILGITAPLFLGKDLAALSPDQVARLVMQTVARYCKSADHQISAHHVPRVKGMTHEQHKALAAEIAPHADTAWKDLVSLEGRLRFTHDHYFKIWAASGPKLEADYVLFDEAQDANPALTGVIESQAHTQRVAVGDSAQQIYGWRGAVDALEQFDGTQLTLSQSFRFGPAVADSANRWLDLLDAPLRLTGFDKIPSRIGQVHRPDAILCRTNAGAMAQAMEHMAAGHRTAVVGGGTDIRALADAAVALMAGATTSHPELMAFTSWDQVCDYAENEDDGADLLPMVKLIDKYGAEELIRATQRLTDEKRAEVTVSTAHKSKGREWSTVKISDDFREPPEDPKTKLKLVRPDEARLAYVAVTRAKEVLDEEGLSWVTKVDGITG